MNKVRYVKETTFLDSPHTNVPLQERWELTASFDEKPVSIVAPMKDGRTIRLDQP